MKEYRREIDGLRALAVVPVILFHAGFQAFSGGFVGVDVFFVISGYLITSIILSERQEGRFRIVNFYERRARRILPALFFMMAASLPFAWLWLLPQDLKSFSDSLMAVAAFASNILFWRQSGYFDTAAELKPLLHTWSLAVEEQYYVLFPLFLMVAWHLRRRWMAALLLLVGAASLALAQWGAHHKPEATFFLLPTRAWELLIGAVIAFYFLRDGTARVRRPIGEAASLAGFLLIVYAVFAFDKNTPFPSLYALAPTVGTGLIILFATPSTLVGQLLGSRLFVGIGLLSYSTYLWHQPIFAFARIRSPQEPSGTVFLLLSLLSIVLAYFSWRFVERPFRSRQVVSRSKVFAFSVVSSLVFALVGWLGHSQDGFKDYFYQHRLSDEQRTMARLIEQHTAYDMYDHMFDDGQCRFWDRNITPRLTDRFNECARRHGKAVIVLGDSHALNLYNVIAKARVDPFTVGISQGYCRIMDTKDFCQYENFKSFLKAHASAVKVVVYHQSGNVFLTDAKGRIDFPRKYDGDAELRIDTDGIRKVVDYLAEQGALAPVVWVGPWVDPQVDVNKILYRGATMNGVSLRNFTALDQQIKALLPSFDTTHRVKYRSLADEIAFDGKTLWQGDCLLYKDPNHFSRCGEDWMAVQHKAFWTSVIDNP